MKKNKAKKITSEITGLLCSMIVLIPLLLIMLNSFKNTKAANQLSLSLDGVSFSQILQNYSDVFTTTKLYVAYFNSVLVTGLSIFFIVLLSSMMSFIIERRRGKISEAVNYLLVAGMMLPASIICQYYMIKTLGLNGTIPGAVLVFVVGSLPLSVFLYTGFYKSIPRELDESGIVDGCGPYRLFFSIIFPLLKPASVTVSIITGMSIWNNFSVSIFLLNSPKNYTVVTTIYSFLGSHTSDWNLLFADIILISLPIIIMYLLLQNFIVDGMTAGAVKG